MMTLDESNAEADRIFAEAGWKASPIPPWRGGFCAPGMVGGMAPNGATYVKVYSAFPQAEAAARGLDPAIYPDEPHEAAAVLVAQVAAKAAPAPEPEAEEIDVRHSESEEAAPEAAADESSVGGGAGAAAAGDDGSAADGGDGGGGALVPAHGSNEPGDSYEDEDGPAVWDADFTEPELTQHPDDEFGGELDDPEGRLGLEGPDLGAEIADAEDEVFVPSEPSRFYGLDDLDRRRSLRIGDVIRHAKTLMPFWTTNEHAEMVELRNFVMGVSERRWDDDPARRERLEELEATRRRINQIEDARDQKVEFLEGASRAEVEAFDVEADWP